MACQLKVRGFAESGGKVFIDSVWRDNWDSSQPIPTISFQGNPAEGGGGTYYRYFDGLGGNFSNTGWYSVPEYHLVGCATPSVNPAQPFDCLNGGCIPKTTYNTPGVYASLSACEAGCAKNSTCTGECVSAEDMAALQAAADSVKSRLCG